MIDLDNPLIFKQGEVITWENIPLNSVLVGDNNNVLLKRSSDNADEYIKIAGVWFLWVINAMRWEG